MNEFARLNALERKPRLVFFGNERLATGLISTDTPTLKALIKHGYDIAAVVSSFTQGRGRGSRALEIAQTAKDYNIPLLLPRKLSDIKDQLKNYGAEAAVLVAYGKIIPLDIINIFPKGIINIHPSLLPKYRGPTPIEQAILNGDHATGVSIMQLSPEMDAGPIFAQKRIPLSDTEEKAELARALLDAGQELLIEVLPRILNGTLKPEAQNNSQATYTKLLKKSDGHISGNKPAIRYEHEVRAYRGYPKSRVIIEGREVIVAQARVAKDKNDGFLIIKCQPGWLEILELIAPTGRLISGADFLRGYAKKS